MIGTMAAVALGGAGGAVARYGVHLAVAGALGLHAAWATLAVNVAGCAAAGVLAALLADPAHPARALAAIGFLGAFTTFSAFAVDALALAHGGRTLAAALYAGGTLIASLAAAAGGFALTKSWGWA
jgi:fluoride exporter